MGKSLITIKDIENQESFVKSEFEKRLGKDRDGFCDFALESIELMLQGITFTNKDKLNENNEYRDFKHALRTIASYHFLRIVFTFKSAYNLVANGYYTESTILLRSILETFIRLKFIDKKKDMNLAIQSFVGHRKYKKIKGEKYKVSIEVQFKEISPKLYDFYRILCDMTHGALLSNIPKLELVNHKITYATLGLEFNPQWTGFIINQFSVYLLAHLKIMLKIFPEIEENMTEEFALKYKKTIIKLQKVINEFEDNKGFNSLKELLK